jgi:kinetochore protein Spc25
MKKKDIEILSLKSSSHAQALHKEQQEAAEMRSTISNIESQRESRAANCDRIRQRIEETQKLIKQRLESQQAHAKQLDSQSRFNVPELDFWQDYLCLRIEGAGQFYRLIFVYTHIDERNWEREGRFELDMDKREYEVFHCRPKLPSDRVEKVLDKLNESRDLGVFLKEMRELFVEAAQ